VSQALVDDRTLRSLLSRQAPSQLRALVDDRSIWTTLGWYHRLCLSLASLDRPGVLSAPVVALPMVQQSKAIDAVANLPHWVGLLPGRDVGWPMAVLRHKHAPQIRLNFLAAEPLAAAAVLGRDTVIVIAEGNVPPSLAAAAEHEGIPVRTVPMR
jgi:hypothetical protein